MALERVRVHRLKCDTCNARTITVPTMEELRALAKGIHWHATEADLAAERAERASSRALIESIVTHCDHYGERAVVSSIALALSEVADRNATHRATATRCGSSRA